MRSESVTALENPVLGGVFLCYKRHAHIDHPCVGSPSLRCLSGSPFASQSALLTPKDHRYSFDPPENPVLGGVFLCLAELRNSATQVPSSFLQVLSGIVLVPRSQQVFQRLPHQITSDWIWCASYYVFNNFNRFNSAFRVVRWRVDLIAHGSLNGTAGPVLVGNSGMMSST